MADTKNTQTGSAGLPKWRDASDGDLLAALAKVKYGHNPEAARSLIEYFHERFRDSDGYSEKILLELVYHAFEKIIKDGWTADQAFGLKLRRGHYEREDTTIRDVELAAYVIRRTRDGANWITAIGDAANLISDSGGESIVKTAYSKYRATLEIMSDEWLDGYLPAELRS